MTEDPHQVIEEYLLLVRSHLPESIANDVIDELRDYIADAAKDISPTGITVDSARRVVARFGAPSEVANEYIQAMITPVEEPIPTAPVPISKNGLFVLGIVTLLVPYGMSWGGYSYNPGSGYQIDTVLVALLWSITSSGEIRILFHEGLIFGVFNLLFAIQLVRYCQGYTTANKLYIAGLFSLVFPVFERIWTAPWINELGIFFYVGPIPFQLAIGLILLGFRESPDTINRWKHKIASILRRQTPNRASDIASHN